MNVPPQPLVEKLRQIQKTEITEYHVYRRLAATLPEGPNRRLLEQIANEEAAHAKLWAKYTGEQLVPNKLRVLWFVCIGRVLGLAFSLKLMELGEKRAEATYRELRDFVPEAETVAQDEDKHENELLALINEERLQYTGSMVLGLNDALVELTGALAGLTLALRNTRLIAMSGLVTGIAAALSMASSEYLSTRAEHTGKAPLNDTAVTGWLPERVRVLAKAANTRTPSANTLSQSIETISPQRRPQPNASTNAKHTSPFNSAIPFRINCPIHALGGATKPSRSTFGRTISLNGFFTATNPIACNECRLKTAAAVRSTEFKLTGLTLHSETHF